jgi:hypothetical protein
MLTEETISTSVIAQNAHNIRNNLFVLYSRYTSTPTIDKNNPSMTLAKCIPTCKP